MTEEMGVADSVIGEHCSTYRNGCLSLTFVRSRLPIVAMKEAAVNVFKLSVFGLERVGVLGVNVKEVNSGCASPGKAETHLFELRSTITYN